VVDAGFLPPAFGGATDMVAPRFNVEAPRAPPFVAIRELAGRRSESGTASKKMVAGSAELLQSVIAVVVE
jgi:hypothetical protein